MAEGGTPQRSFKDSFSKASGDAEELFCDPCINGDNWVAVEGYCPICKEYLCGSCLKVHKNQKLSRNHTILDKNQMPTKQRHNTSQSLCTEICQTHHPEIIRYYCKAHDEPGCVDCMTLNHATCKKDRVQDISDGFQATKEFKQIHQKLDKFHEELKIMKETLDHDFNDLETAYNNIQQNITTFREEINIYLDQIQKQISDEAAKMKKEYETDMKRIIAENQAMKSELEDRIQTLKNDKDMNSIFVHTKQAKQRLVTMEKEMNTIKETERKHKHYVFRPSSEIQSILSAKTPLGKLSITPNIHTTVSYRGSVNMKSRNDTSKCWITGGTLLNPQRMVVTDPNNHQVKIIDLEADRIIFSYSPSSVPWGITAVNTETVAVTLPEEGKIELLHVTSNRIQHQNQINCSTSECSGIAYHDGKFAVSYLHRVEIMDIQGKVLHTIQPKQGTEDVLQMATYITFGHEKDTVIVSDKATNTVSVVSFKGEILHTYTLDALSSATGIALTEDGLLFVCSWGYGCVHVVSPDFKRSKIIINKDENVVNFWNITYCDIMQRLYISNYNSVGDLMNNSLQVYDLDI